MNAPGIQKDDAVVASQQECFRIDSELLQWQNIHGMWNHNVVNITSPNRAPYALIGNRIALPTGSALEGLSQMEERVRELREDVLEKVVTILKAPVAKKKPPTTPKIPETTTPKIPETATAGGDGGQQPLGSPRSLTSRVRGMLGNRPSPKSPKMSPKSPKMSSPKSPKVTSPRPGRITISNPMPYIIEGHELDTFICPNGEVNDMYEEAEVRAQRRLEHMYNMSGTQIVRDMILASVELIHFHLGQMIKDTHQNVKIPNLDQVSRTIRTGIISRLLQEMDPEDPTLGAVRADFMIPAPRDGSHDKTTTGQGHSRRLALIPSALTYMFCIPRERSVFINAARARLETLGWEPAAVTTPTRYPQSIECQYIGLLVYFSAQLNHILALKQSMAQKVAVFEAMVESQPQLVEAALHSIPMPQRPQSSASTVFDDGDDDDDNEDEDEDEDDDDEDSRNLENYYRSAGQTPMTFELLSPRPDGTFRLEIPTRPRPPPSTRR